MGLATAALSALGITKKAVLIVKKNPPSKQEEKTRKQKTALKLANPFMSEQAILEHVNKSGLNILEARQIEVQYNPASLSFKGNSEPITTNFLRSNINGGVGPQAVYQPSISMSVELVFDDTNTSDAFNQDIGGLGLGSVVSAASNLAGEFLPGWEHSVLKETQGMMAMLSDRTTREVVFCWNNLAFSGVVAEAQATYTMFNTKGVPIRSKVSLRIAETISTKNEALTTFKQLKKGANPFAQVL